MLPSRSLVALLLAATTTATALEPAQLQALQWRSIGPSRGGRVLAVAGVPNEREHFYFGAVNGGVWETRDVGRTWQPLFDAQSTGSIGALAIAPSDSKVLYVGTGEADMRNDIAQGVGLFKSDDGGKTWRHSGLADSQQIARIRVHPDDANTVFVAALGHPYGPNAERGLFKSVDGGAHWKKVLGPNADTGAVDVIFAPDNPQIVYAALWQTRRTPWSVYPPSNGPGSGLYKSTDGGEHWNKIGEGLPEAHGRIGLAISTAAPQRVYVTVDAEPGGGVYRSDDAGAHWRLMSGDNRLWQRGWYFGEIAVDPKDADHVFAMNTIVLESHDGGAHFMAQKGDTTGDDFHALWIDERDPQRRILGVDQGAIITLNGGASWSSWYNQPTGQFYHVSTDNRFPYFVYGAQQDSGAAGVPSRTTHGDGISMANFRETTAGGEADNIAPDPDDPDTIFGGRVDKLDLRTRQTRHVDPTLAYPDTHRHTWTLPLTFSPRDAKRLYFADQHLYRTTDAGAHWDQLSPDLTREDPGTPRNLDAVTAAHHLQMGSRRGVIYAIAPSKLRDNDIWVGTDDGKVWRTQDEGAHWQDITPKQLSGWSKVGIIDASAHSADSAYIAVERHRLDDARPYIYKTHDGGKSWQLIVDGIASTHFVNAVREDPQRPGLLYAATERGVYASLDDGAHWQALQQNLPRTSVRDLVVKDNDLVIATHGRGFWIMDDVSALRQLAAEASNATRLFAPADTVRLRPESFSGTPMPKDEPLATNPPAGAVIDYHLASAPTQPIVLTIHDARGVVVRRYSSADAPAKVEAASSSAAPEWLPLPVTLQSTPGMHRFFWPMRYAAPKDLTDDAGVYADGVWAPPGEYRVTLEVDGQNYTQALRLLPDPRVKLDPSAYAEEFALAQRIEGLRVQVAQAASQAKQWQKALSARRAGADAPTAKVLGTLQAALTRVTGSVPTSNPSNSWWLPPKTLDSLRYVDTALEALDHAVDGADAAPSADARAGVTHVEARLPRVMAAWQQWRERELAAANRQLAALKQAELALTP